MKAFRIALAHFVIAVGSGAGIEAVAQDTQQATTLEPFVTLVREFDARRRVNVLYPNPQSLFDGLQIGFVNTSAGNLSFRRRDLVARSGGPLVFARVHDSRIRVNPDFGPRWRLSLAEEVRFDGSVAVYVDGAGAHHRFPAGGGHLLSPTPRHAGSRLFVAGDAPVVLREADGTVRRFAVQGKGAVALLTSLEDAYGFRIDLEYRDGLLVAIKGPEGVIFSIERAGPGKRITSVTDNRRRMVRYSYNAAGQLKEVRDLAGNAWRHEYGQDGELTAAAGPNGRHYLRVHYHGDGRVAKTSSGREFEFDYRELVTVVREGTGPVHAFARNGAGATVGFESTNGVKWDLAFDGRNRVESLALPDRSWRYHYGERGEVTEIEGTSPHGNRRWDFGYDAWGRLASAWSSVDGESVAVDYAQRNARVSGAGIDFGFDRSEAGEVVHATDGDTRVEAEYDGAGDLVALRSDDASVEMVRDGHRRIAAIRFASGETNRYAYDALGNRNRVDFGGGGSVRYRHDAAGNIVTVEVEEANGIVRRQHVHVGAMNRVERIEYEGAGTVDVIYDGRGMPVKLLTSHDEITVVHDDLGHLVRLASSATDQVWTGRGEADGNMDATVFEDRLSVLSRDTAGRTQAKHGVVAFDADTFRPQLADPLELGIPGLADARRLYRTAAPLLDLRSLDAEFGFARPSNPAFQPAEYRSTNCCIPCPTCIEFCVGTPPGDLLLPGTSAEVCFCVPIGDPGGGGGGGTDDDVIRDVTIEDVPVEKKGTATPDDAGNVEFGVTDMTAKETVACEAVGGSQYKLLGQATIGDMKIVAKTFRQLGSCKRNGRGNDVDITIAHEEVHAQKILDVINASNDDPALGDVFDSVDSCKAVLKAWQVAYDRALKHEQKRQVHHCDHIGEYKRQLTCTFPGGFTGERASSSESYPDPGSEICAPTP